MCCSVAILKPTHVIPQTVIYPLSPCIYINNSYICQYSFICNSIVPFLDFILLFVYPRISSVFALRCLLLRYWIFHTHISTIHLVLLEKNVFQFGFLCFAFPSTIYIMCCILCQVRRIWLEDQNLWCNIFLGDFYPLKYLPFMIFLYLLHLFSDKMTWFKWWIF